MYVTKKDEDVSPFARLDKGVVLQEKSFFNETPIRPRSCIGTITKLLFLIHQGDVLKRNEATDMFFAVTKLIQSNDHHLRRFMYLILKELIPLSDNVIMMISSLLKDVSSNVSSNKANSIRCLCKVSDTNFLPQIERYFKQCIVDKDSTVSSAALVSSYQLFMRERDRPKEKSKDKVTAEDIVRRWVGEIQEALNSRSSMVQYHALGLLYVIKQKDRLAVAKLTSTMGAIRSPYAHTLLVRIAKKIILEDGKDSQTARSMIDFIVGSLKNNSDIVVLEAARAICDMPFICTKELSGAVSSLQYFLNSTKTVLRFAAVKTLNKLASTHALIVSVCNLDLENIINDANRSISTLAISCLLKTGSESSIERLMKQIYSFIGEVSDEFKIQIIEALKTLCLKFPQKYKTLVPFFSFMLREDGGVEYKKSAVDSILHIMSAVPESKELGLSHLCEFIEDCEYSLLATRILYVLSQEGPKTANPAKYIRYIYNRTALENSTVRASAVTALARFGTLCSSLVPQVTALLKRCLCDVDDEVRDRAVFYLSVISNCPKEDIQKFVCPSLEVPIENLENALLDYLLSEKTDKPFDIESVPKESSAKKRPISASPEEKILQQTMPSFTEAETVTTAKALLSIPELAPLGTPWKSSNPNALTEQETEYVVSVIKHSFAENIIVLQFKVRNTIPEHMLCNVTVELDLDEIDFALSGKPVMIDKLRCNEEKSCYIVLKAKTDPSELPPTGSFAATLKFTVKEVDEDIDEDEEPSDEGEEDEYPLEAVEIAVGDYMTGSLIVDWASEWERIGEESQEIRTYKLAAIRTLDEAVKEVVKFLGMSPCDGSDKVSKDAKRHILYLGGRFLGGIPVIARARMKPDAAGVALELCVRCETEGIAALVSDAL